MLVCLAACAPEQAPPPEKLPPLVKVAPEEWPLLLDDLSPLSLHEACQESLDYLERIPADKRFTFGKETFTAAELLPAVARLQDILFQYPDPARRTEALKAEFDLYMSTGRDGRGEVLMTGYYEPILEATREELSPFVHPLYAVPRNLLYIDLSDFDPELPPRRLVARVEGSQVVPYYDRESIDFDRSITQEAEILGYLADPVDAFFLHIQGSGKLRFPDGVMLRVGFAATNGRPYRSIGKLLLAEKLMDPDSMSMQGIRKFLDANPEQLRRVLSANPSYVFFRPLDPEGGPLGCYQAPLTEGRSIATDRRIFPGLMVGYVEGTRPAPNGQTTPLGRFIVNQDTGGAIRGPGRLDLFFGSGYEAGDLAGRMKHPGRLYFFAPKRG